MKTLDNINTTVDNNKAAGRDTFDGLTSAEVAAYHRALCAPATVEDGPVTYYLAPPDDESDRHAAGYEGNCFRTEQEAERASDELRTIGPDFDIDWKVVAIENDTHPMADAVSAKTADLVFAYGADEVEAIRQTLAECGGNYSLAALAFTDANPSASVDEIITEMRRRVPTILVKEFCHDSADPEELRSAEVPEAVSDAIRGCARGSYQWSLLVGQESWSGSTLRGRAREYSAHYATSRAALCDRIDNALTDLGWSARVALVLSGSPQRWRRELVLTDPEGRAHIW